MLPPTNGGAISASREALEDGWKPSNSGTRRGTARHDEQKPYGQRQHEWLDPPSSNQSPHVSHRFLIVALRFQFNQKKEYFQPERHVFTTLFMTENRSRRIHAHPHRYEKGENTKQALSGALPPPTTFLCAETSPSRSRTRRT